MVFLTFRSSGNGNFRAAQNIGLASGFNLMEVLAPFTVGNISDTSALDHRSMDSLQLFKISLPNKPKFLSASTTALVYINLVVIIKHRRKEDTEKFHFMLVMCFNSVLLFFKFRLPNLLSQLL